MEGETHVAGELDGIAKEEPDEEAPGRGVGKQRVRACVRERGGRERERQKDRVNMSMRGIEMLKLPGPSCLVPAGRFFFLLKVLRVERMGKAKGRRRRVNHIDT